MRITLLIGNGFDIGLGLETTYKAFLEKYVELPSKDDGITKFRKRLKGELQEDSKNLHHAKWADCEAAKGEDTRNYDDADEFLAYWDDFFGELTDYLSIQNSRLMKEGYNDLGDLLWDDLLTMHLSLGDKDKDTVLEHPDYFEKSQMVYNVVSFNYTKCFDALFSAKEGKELRYWVKGGTRYIARTGKIVHPHGTLEEGNLVFGVNDASQVENQVLLEDPRVFVDMIKGNACNACKSYQKDESVALIESADLIYVFGMSVGDSDREWWERIGQWLLGDSERLLILHKYKYKNGYITSLTPIHKQSSAESEVRTRFLMQAGLDEEEAMRVSPQILISFDRGFLNYKEAAEKYVKPLA